MINKIFMVNAHVCIGGGGPSPAAPKPELLPLQKFPMGGGGVPPEAPNEAANEVEESPNEEPKPEPGAKGTEN